MKTLLRALLLAAIVVSLLVTGISCSRGYSGSVGSILHKLELLDEDVHGVISLDKSFGSGSVSISTGRDQFLKLVDESRELMDSLALLIPSDGYSKAHETLLTALSARASVLEHYEHYLSNAVRIDWKGAQCHMNKALWYMENGDDEKSSEEERKAYEMAIENAKWIEYAMSGLDDCEEAIERYLVALQLAGIELGVDISSSIKASDLGYDRKAMDKLNEITQKNLAMHEKANCGCT